MLASLYEPFEQKNNPLTKMAVNGVETTVMEIREDFMASNPCCVVQQGHFLNPSLPTNELALSPPHAFTYPRNNSVSLKVNFKGWQTPYQPWNEWVQNMEPRFGPMWRTLGIFDAIKNSTIQICPQTDVVLGLARKWFHKTNTFVFKWGEVSVTLEDVCVLGGYPVVGQSVLLPQGANNQEIVEMDRKLVEARKMIRMTGLKKVPLKNWIQTFRENINGFGDLEHVGFLVFWLSKYVFPRQQESNVVGKHVHTVAIRLAMGVKIALGPAVLASIYRDLRTLEYHICLASASRGEVANELEIWGPMHLVQVWAWERFWVLRPEPNFIVPNQQIMARWDGCMHPTYDFVLNVDFLLETRSLGFIWRPYASFSEHHGTAKSLYTDKKQMVLDFNFLDDDVASMVRFVRPSELVGLDLIEQYLPHRVAKQFGFDQDVPGRVGRFNHNKDVAWANYSRPVYDPMLYIPPRNVETNVTKRYMAWWNRSRSVVEAGPSRRGN